MKVGDLVNFHTGAWVFKHAECRYANPGVVLAVYPTSCGGQQSAEVYWRDGKITREYGSYLRSAMVDEDSEQPLFERVARGGSIINESG